MKKILILSICLISLFTLQAQDVKISKHFISSDNWRVAVGTSLDVALASNKGKSNLIKFINPNINDDIYKFGNSASYALNVDIYSANSVIGFYTSANYNINRIILSDEVNSKKDSINLNFIELPIYLKMRFGKTNGHGQLWLAFGAGYALPVNSTIKTFDSYNYQLYGTDSKDIANAVPFTSTMLGYEIILGKKMNDFEINDNFRILIYAKLNNDLGNRLNNSYAFDNDTVISDYNNANMQFRKISFGVSFLMRINAFARLLLKNI